jgi:hypothetical protein
LVTKYVASTFVHFNYAPICVVDMVLFNNGNCTVLMTYVDHVQLIFV